MEEPFHSVISHTGELYDMIRRAAPHAAPYILTNAHRKRVIMKINARELYHMTRLRMDRHAQWDIRDTVGLMLHAAKQVMPLTLMMAAGKDAFIDRRGEETILPDES